MRERRRGRVVLQNLEVLLTVGFGATGVSTLPVPIPVTPWLGHTHLYFQIAVLDPGTSSGLAASDGLDMLLR